MFHVSERLAECSAERSEVAAVMLESRSSPSERGAFGVPQVYRAWSEHGILHYRPQLPFVLFYRDEPSIRLVDDFRRRRARRVSYTVVSLFGHGKTAIRRVSAPDRQVTGESGLSGRRDLAR